jgi:hypothetical protein
MDMESDRVHLQICRSAEHCSRVGQIAEEQADVDRPLRIIVPYTTPALTRAALSEASVLATDLRAEAVLLAVREIPYPLPLDRPDFQPTFLLEQLKTLTDGISCSVRIELVLARSRRDVFERIIGPGAMAVVATKRRWWRTREERLARLLSRAGGTVSLLTLRKGTGGVHTRQLCPVQTVTSTGAATREVNHA